MSEQIEEDGGSNYERGLHDVFNGVSNLVCRGQALLPFNLHNELLRGPVPEFFFTLYLALWTAIAVKPRDHVPMARYQCGSERFLVPSTAVLPRPLQHVHLSIFCSN